jgi:hypothetical protein
MEIMVVIRILPLQPFIRDAAIGCTILQYDRIRIIS